jgi:hypothetical protein
MSQERPAAAPAEEMRGLIQLARRELLRNTCGQDDEIRRERLIEAQRRALARRRRGIWGVSLLAGATFALIVQRALSVSEPLLPYSIKQHEVAGPNGRAFVASYVFSDGTSITLARDAALAIMSADRADPRVRLDRGEAEIKVVHRANAHWKFVAGPFEVAVVGTAFDLQWNPVARDFSLNLREGVVEITGPVLAGPLLLRAGHQVFVSLETGRVAITTEPRLNGAVSAQPPAPALQPAPAPMAIPPSSSTALVTASALSSSTRESARLPPSATPSSASWRALVGRGRFAAVLREAQAWPLEACFSRCTAPDLRALGDAARYSGQASLAERAFLALRERFADTSDGKVAAFLLGRTYETQRRLEQAAAWYSRYLAEAPTGAFAVEAASGRARVADKR